MQRRRRRCVGPTTVGQAIWPGLALHRRFEAVDRRKKGPPRTSRQSPRRPSQCYPAVAVANAKLATFLCCEMVSNHLAGSTEGLLVACRRSQLCRRPAVGRMSRSGDHAITRPLSALFIPHSAFHIPHCLSLPPPPRDQPQPGQAQRGQDECARLGDGLCAFNCDYEVVKHQIFTGAAV